ncbi:MAG TPA: hypothetical protein VKR21_06870 [Solirubrobacteraceae bacterium]|nr:hypothetical protein [Solirubrobacteraceae bacterium]
MDARRAMTIVEGLESFAGRGAGTDAERRAANWLARQAGAEGRDTRLETFWCRPNWALAHAWHVALAITGSLISLASPVAGIVILAVALGSVLADDISGVSLGRRLTPERASQNLIGSAAEPTSDRTRLILTANYDAGRTGLAYRLRPITARFVNALRGLTPGWLGWLAIAIAWLEAIAVVRELGHSSHVLGAIQFPPTAGLLLGFALLLELGTGRWSPAAGDNGSGVAAAVEVADALLATPPKHLQVEIALTGAAQTGLRQRLRAGPTKPRYRWRRQRHNPRPAGAIVLGIAVCASGAPHWWQSDGALIPLRYSSVLRRVAARIAEDEPHLGIGAHRGRGSGGASVARSGGLASITVGSLERTGAPARSHQQADTSAAVDLEALDRMVQFTLMLVDGIDAAVGDTVRPPTTTRA